MSKNTSPKKEPLQLRIPRDDQRGAELIAKIEKISKANSLSMNDVANLAVAAGLPMVEAKLKEIHEPAKAA